MADAREPVVVIGLGRFGTALALELAERGHEVLAVDRSDARVQALSGQLTQVVAADSTDIDALRQLGVQDFYRAVVAIGSELEPSILTTSLLVELEIEDIWAKAVSDHHGRILRRIGAHHVVFPEHEMGERVAHLLSGQLLDYMPIDTDFALAKIRPPHSAVGVPLAESRLRSRHGVTAVAVKREDGSFTYAGQDTVLSHDDTILIVGREADIERLVTRS
ncbi:potassium channel family protein [Pseudonocardia sp. RS010]|uniref:potassium channel family protein n=1 Tax=Pseudonocardia sp. RS010 TaxID=3385979 RepID=UPI0039A0E998